MPATALVLSNQIDDEQCIFTDIPPSMEKSFKDQIGGYARPSTLPQGTDIGTKR
jgi:hypothetical protein